MTRNGIPIWEHGVRRPVSTGIEFDPEIPDCVPQYEVREAAVYCRYNPMEFYDLPWQERAMAVAQYRIRRWVDLNADDAVQAASEAAARRNR